MNTELDTEPPATPAPSRDPVDLAALFADHHLGLVRLAFLLLGDRAGAEDVVQEAFERTHARRLRIREPDRALAYVRSCVLNGCRSTLRRRAVSLRRPVPYEPPVWSAESAAILGEERREVLLALDGLPARQREALVLRYYFGLTDPEIADAMGVGGSTARSTITRGLTALARKLGGDR
ncbi:RNA polymerase sigma24 factor [Sphaerisporangium rufum]|uniref:RNA polymerase sigma24 factor n=1 Tax=Sphaerisporangium rufum TaxID=1381558 RepID=A0A919R965_9ACTN|nr:SigE family RNA polymerase sigma factor [Sphaerisporangium rufum]GII81528.1 RNA polymerase sigma24 factor [Sphaerisporangium rufum]